VAAGTQAVACWAARTRTSGPAKASTGWVAAPGVVADVGSGAARPAGVACRAGGHGGGRAVGCAARGAG
jgi:hypothetical protein